MSARSQSTSAGIILLMLISATDVTASQTCDELPVGSSFAAYTNNEWQVYIKHKAGQLPRAVNTEWQARSPAYDASRSRLYYIDSGGSLLQRDLKHNKETVLLAADKQSVYSQSNTRSDSPYLYAVRLIGRKSQLTEIIQLNKDSLQSNGIVRQRSAQLDPSQHGDWLYYTNTHCVEACGRIIMESWRYNLVTRQARQVTLQHNLARSPSGSSDGRWMYYSSNVSGGFQLYRKDMESQKTEQLSQAEASHENPVFTDGSLYFLKKTPEETGIYCQRGDRTVRIERGMALKKIRDLQL